MRQHHGRRRRLLDSVTSPTGPSAQAAGWFLTVDEVPTELEGYSVRLSEAEEEGVAGHLMILDGAT